MDGMNREIKHFVASLDGNGDESINTYPIIANDFGATGDGISDDTMAIQTAIDTLESHLSQGIAADNVVYLRKGTYGISQPLRISQGIKLKGVGVGDETQTASQPDSPATVILALDEVEAMIIVKSKIDGNYIYFPEIDGIYFKGDHKAIHGVQLCSTRHAQISIYGERVCGSFLRVDDSNNALNGYTNIKNCFYQSGNDPKCEKSIGLEFTAITKFGLTRAMGGIIDVIGGKNGAGLYVGDIDASYFQFVNAAVKPDGTGKGIELGTDFENGGREPRTSRKNFFAHVNGKICARKGSLNWIGFINSEPSQVEIETGASLHYSVIDRKNAMRFVTNRFVMSDTMAFNVNDFKPFIESKLGVVSNKETVTGSDYDTWEMYPNADTALTATNNIPANWSKGRLTAVRVFFMQLDDLEGDVIFEAKLQAKSVGEGLAGGSSSYMISKPVTKEYIHLQSIDIPTDKKIRDESEIVQVILTRKGCDSGDTYPNSIFILGAKLVFKAAGPHGEKHKIWDVPADKIVKIVDEFV